MGKSNDKASVIVQSEPAVGGGGRVWEGIMKSYVRGKYAKAACSLVDHLRELGVAAQVGYGNKKPSKLVAFVDERDAAKVPSIWQELPVVIGDWSKVKPAEFTE